MRVAAAAARCPNQWEKFDHQLLPPSLSPKSVTTKFNQCDVAIRQQTYTHWQVGDVRDCGSKESDEKDEHEEDAKADNGCPFSETCALIVFP
jgi:hypothetical protein